MRKTELPTTRKAQKWKKQSFQLLGRLKNEKNEASDYLEGLKVPPDPLTERVGGFC